MLFVGHHLPFLHNELEHLPYMAVALIPRVPSPDQTRIWLSVFRRLEFPSASGGLPPRLLLPSGRLGLSPGAWGASNKGNADEAVDIFGKCRARVGYGPALAPTKKGLVPHLPVRWGVQQILQSWPVWDQISPRVRPEEPFLLLKYILTLSLILRSYY